jgi:uncharacterized protein YodC (DUF2158 family)
MPQNEFKIADIAQLNSGGPRMTVYEVHNNLVSCVYWNQENKKYEVFQSQDYATLTKVEQ